MAQQTPNADEVVYTLTPRPGIKRDGTLTEGENCTDGQWVRFQRGKARKIGGYRRITADLMGPINKILLWSRVNLNSLISFSMQGIETLLVDNNLVGNAIYDRTPSGFTSSVDNIWSADTQYDDAVGTTASIILAHCSQSMLNIDDDTASKPYWALASSASSQFAVINDAPAVSGGIFSLPPYTVCYGSDGFVAWSDANQPQVWSTSANPGDAGADRVTAAKIVAGLPMRAGTQSAILWSLDSVIRMNWVGGSAIFSFSTLSTQSSMLAQNSVIEYDGVYYWIGVDRFMFFDSRVQELPNDMNQNYFFDNLNYTYRQKVWATKVPRYGEIWWFYPRGDETECSHAIIYNVRERTWYDIELARAAGYYSQIRRYPVWAGSNTEPDTPTDFALQPWTRVTTTATVTRIGHGYTTGDEIEITATSSAAAIPIGTYTITVASVDTFTFTCNNAGDASGTITYNTIEPTYGVYQHEFGYNASVGDDETAIPSYFTTQNFGYLTGLVGDSMEGNSRWTRLTRIEPDFVMNDDGNMSVTVLGYEYADSEEETPKTYDFTQRQGRVDTRVQFRHMLLKFMSNELNGTYQAGKILIHTEPGDNRS